jgi:TetR/AcrR family fatty acid metabolism transcriptional regulator
MSTHSPQASKGGDKRERILGAAERVFAKCGFYNARVAEIAKEAGVADGTIYLYFKNKDDLLISLFEDRMERVNQAMERAVSTADTPQEKFHAFTKTYMTLVKEQPNVAEVLTVELRQSAKFMKEYSNPRFGDFLKILASVIDEGQKSGVFDDTIPPAVVSRAIFGMIDELALAWVLGKSDRFDIVQAADWIGALVLSGLERRKS